MILKIITKKILTKFKYYKIYSILGVNEKNIGELDSILERAGLSVYLWSPFASEFVNFDHRVVPSSDGYCFVLCRDYAGYSLLKNHRCSRHFIGTPVEVTYEDFKNQVQCLSIRKNNLFKVKDKVKVTSGYFIGWEGIIKKIGRTGIYVEIPLFSKKTRLVFGVSELKKINR